MFRGRFLTVAMVILTPLTAVAESSIAILPQSVTLSGTEASQRLLVQEKHDGHFGQQLPLDKVEFQSSNPEVVELLGDVAKPVGKGQATIIAKVGKEIAKVTVTVKGMEKTHQWSFRNHVLAIMAKAGCNSGACHGALAGKGGFKLSLRGYDPETDHFTITKQARGRRIELADPGRSLILTKPTGAIPHKGGLRFEINSPEYRILSEWISNGAEAPKQNDPRIDRLEVLPPRVLLKPGVKQQMLVRAHYNDGHVEDVTRWVKFGSTDEAVCNVDEQGQVNVIGHGEGAITAWFASKIAIARITSPYGNNVPDSVFSNAKRHNFIDELNLAQLKELRLPPSPLTNDSGFIRRAFIDTIGTLPTPKEVTDFLKDKSPDKRDKLIDHLLARPEFVDYWTYRWSDLLLLNGQNLRPNALKAYYQWIREQVTKNTPWNEFVTTILTATGSSYENGATNFFALHQDPETMSENASQAFLGLSIGCAKCHNHPLEKWTNDQYYAMANLFSRVRAKGWGGDSRNGDGLRTLYVVEKGELIQPLTGKPQPPTPLDGESLPFDSTRDRRIHLAKWLTSPENPYFSRAIANRLWHSFFGKGLVEPVDDLRVSNPASNEKLLTALADYLIEKKFDLKELMRAILRSATYQRSSNPLPENKDEQRYFSRAYPRRLIAEVLLDAYSHVTDVPSLFTEIEFPGNDRRKTTFYPKGTRAIALYDSAVSSYFLSTFGRNQRRITCECERSNEPTMVQVLHIANGNTVNGKLQAKNNCISQWMKQKLSDEQIIDRCYLAGLSRYPTSEEKKKILAVLKESDEDRRTLLEDLLWGVLSSREFLFNH